MPIRQILAPAEPQTMLKAVFAEAGGRQVLHQPRRGRPERDRPNESDRAIATAPGDSRAYSSDVGGRAPIAADRRAAIHIEALLPAERERVGREDQRAGVADRLAQDAQQHRAARGRSRSGGRRGRGPKRVEADVDEHDVARSEPGVAQRGQQVRFGVRGGHLHVRGIGRIGPSVISDMTPASNPRLATFRSSRAVDPAHLMATPIITYCQGTGTSQRQRNASTAPLARRCRSLAPHAPRKPAVLPCTGANGRSSADISRTVG